MLMIEKETQQQDEGAFLYTTYLRILQQTLPLPRSISLVRSEGSPGTLVFRQD